LGADGVFDKSTELEAFFDRCNVYAKEADHLHRGQAGRARGMAPKPF